MEGLVLLRRLARPRVGELLELGAVVLEGVAGAPAAALEDGREVSLQNLV